MDMNTREVNLLRDLVHEKYPDGGLMLQHQWPNSSASSIQNYNTCVPSMDALWGHKTSLSGGSGPRSYWWSDMKRSACGSKGSLDGIDIVGESQLYQKPQNHLFGLLTRAPAVKGDAFITCLYVYLFLFQNSQSVVTFMWMLNCTWGNKGQEKWNFLLLSISNLD